MLLIMMMINLLFSILFIMMKHPLSMGINLLIQVLLISLITGFMHMNWWFSYILFIIMIGGMLVLFIYMTSIASNEKFKYSSKITIFLVISMMIMFSTYMLMDNYFMDFNNFYYENLKFKKWELMLNKFLNFPHNLMLFMIIIYLFISLIAVVKISNIKYGPLRQTN